MMFKLQDESILVPLTFAEPDIITGYILDDPEKEMRSVRWQDVAAFLGSYNFAEDGDFEVRCKDGMRLVPLQFGRPCDAATEDSGPSDIIYGYRADMIQTDIVGKRMIEHISVTDIESISGRYLFSPVITDILD